MNEEKINFIKRQNIPYIKNSIYPLNTLYTLACIQELVSNRPATGIECFGSIEDCSECKTCVLNENGACKTLKDYLILISDSSNLLIISNNNGEILKMDATFINELLEKSKFAPNSISYKIAKIILESNDQPFSNVINRISEVCNNATATYSRTRYYQIRKRLHETTNLDINLVTETFLKIKTKDNNATA